MVAISQSEPFSGRAGTGIRVKLLGAFGAMALLGLVTCLIAVLRGEALLAVIATLSLIAVGPALFVGSHLVRRLDALTRSMSDLARGNLDVVVPELGNDEIGEMAATLGVFRDRARLGREREAQAARESETMSEQRRAELLALAQSFEASVKDVVDTVSGAAGAMQTTAAAMVSTAEAALRQSDAVAEAAERASTNVQTVAGAAEELSVSTSEIGRQVAESARVAHDAVAEAERTSNTV